MYRYDGPGFIQQVAPPKQLAKPASDVAAAIETPAVFRFVRVQSTLTGVTRWVEVPMAATVAELQAQVNSVFELGGVDTFRLLRNNRILRDPTAELFRDGSDPDSMVLVLGAEVTRGPGSRPRPNDNVEVGDREPDKKARIMAPEKDMAVQRTVNCVRAVAQECVDLARFPRVLWNHLVGLDLDLGLVDIETSQLAARHVAPLDTAKQNDIRLRLHACRQSLQSGTLSPSGS
jgi:hypothetical protein